MRVAHSPLRARLAAPSVALTALLLAGCGSTSHPPGGRGVVDSPITTKTNHLKCLQKQQLPVQVTGPTSLQIGSLPAGATVRFLPTPGAAQALQLSGASSGQGGEVIGGALLFPNQASDGELKQIETCLGQGVTG